MSKVKSYPSYSDFNQEWLGELPSHWKVMRTKLLFNLITEPAPVGNNEELLSVYTALGVKPRKDLEARGNKASSTDNYWRVEQGDIIVNKLLAWMGAVGISEYNGVTSPAYDILRANGDVNPYFYNYLFRNPIASREFKRHSRGIMDMRLRLYFTRFGDIKLPQPPLEEQNKIVDYLQFKLKKIDRFIRKKKQLIKLLNEQKAGIINHAVTKGLDPNARMKPSGIDWVGDIPVHWEVKPLKYIADVVLGKMLCNEDKGGYFKKPYLKSKNIQWLRVDITDVEEMWFSEKELNQYRLKNGDLILSEGGEVGKTCIWRDEVDECYIQNSAHKVTIGDTGIPEYYLYLFFNYGIQGGFNSIVNRVSIAHLTQDKLINIKTVCPPKVEQESIVRFIEQENDVFNKTISTIEKEITLTQEYKTVLIAEAVTGKIDVRDFEKPKMLEVEIYDELEEELSMVAEDEAEYETTSDL